MDGTASFRQWDLWADARALAKRLSAPNHRLVVVIGAEAWCEKCRYARQAFDDLAHRAGHGETWLWLDLDEHAAFINDFIPPDLPHACVYEGGRIVMSGTVEQMTCLAAETPGRHGVKPCADADPGILAALLHSDWAR